MVRISAVGTKRVSGLYCESYSAGFNAAFAIILILYRKIAGYPQRKWAFLFIVINLTALFLTTSRCTWLFLFAFLVSYALIRRSAFTLFFLISAGFIFSSSLLKKWFTVRAGDPHVNAVFLFINYFLSHLFSFSGLFGHGIGSRFVGSEMSLLYSESGYGTVFCQLGLFGLISLFLFYFYAMTHVRFSKENRFFVCGMAMSVPALLFFGGYPFGYKTFGLIYLFLGSIMVRSKNPLSSGR